MPGHQTSEPRRPHGAHAGLRWSLGQAGPYRLAHRSMKSGLILQFTVSGADPTKPSTPRHVTMSWARRLKRVFGVEIERCTRCGGQLKIIASIEEPQLIAKILLHLERAAPEQYQSELPLGARGPPGQSNLL